MDTILEIAKWIALGVTTIVGLGWLIIILIHLYDKVFTQLMIFFKMNKLFVQFMWERSRKKAVRPKPKE